MATVGGVLTVYFACLISPHPPISAMRRGCSQPLFLQMLTLSLTEKKELLQLSGAGSTSFEDQVLVTVPAAFQALPPHLSGGHQVEL